MQKLSEVQDPAANKTKADMNTQAAQLLNLDEDALGAEVKKLVAVIMKVAGSPRVLVTGGAGSGKTTVAGSLASLLGVKNLDFDEYIPGGWTSDKNEYARRFNKGLYELWEDVPQKKGWVIEHVEACNPDLVGLYNPDWVVLVDPGEERIRRAAEARTAVTGSGEGRLARALQSVKKAKEQFKAIPGEVELRTPGFVLKKVVG